MNETGQSILPSLRGGVYDDVAIRIGEIGLFYYGLPRSSLRYDLAMTDELGLYIRLIQGLSLIIDCHAEFIQHKAELAITTK